MIMLFLQIYWPLFDWMYSFGIVYTPICPYVNNKATKIGASMLYEHKSSYHIWLLIIYEYF